jgi:hypothetical protein
MPDAPHVAQATMAQNRYGVAGPAEHTSWHGLHAWASAPPPSPPAAPLPAQVHELQFAHVEYVGAAPETETWGMRLSAQPSLMPAYASPFPWQLLGAAGQAGGAPGAAGAAAARLQKVLSPKRWQALASEASRLSRGACEVTGAGPGVVPLELVPVWQYNDEARVVKVRGGCVHVTCVLGHAALRCPLCCVPGSEHAHCSLASLEL